MKKQQISLREIAEATNFSITTVSRVLRNKGELSPETRDIILSYAKEHNYRPNLLIQGIQTGKTGNIGVMIPPYNSYWSEMLKGIHDTLVEYDYAGIMLWDEHKSDTPMQNKKDFMLEQMHRLIDRRVDGVILWPRVSEVYGDHLDELESRNLPVVTIDNELDFSDSVVTDERLAAELAAKHLYSLGHRKIGHLAGQQDWTWARLRRKYFEKAISNYPDAECITEIGSDNAEDIPEIAEKLIKQGPTAIFAFGDWVAFEIYKLANKINIRIPEDLSVMGFSDSDDLTQFANPPLTSIRQKPRQIGIEAAKLLMRRLNNKTDSPNKHIHTIIDCDLIARSSTKSLS